MKAKTYKAAKAAAKAHLMECKDFRKQVQVTILLPMNAATRLLIDPKELVHTNKDRLRSERMAAREIEQNRSEHL